MANKNYVAKVSYVIQEETKTGKIKLLKKNDRYLVNSNSIPQVHKTLKNLLESVYDNFEVASVSESSIIGYIDDTKDVIGNN